MITLRKMKWDEWAIRAELKRRGLTFNRLAENSGISPHSLRASFRKPNSKVSVFIAKSLGIPAHELWPDWFDHDDELIPAKYRIKLSKLRAANASHESRVA